MRLIRLVLCALIITGCSADLSPPGPASSGGFARTSYPTGVARANSELAGDFLALMFAQENGTRLPVLLRYEHPVRVGMASPALAPYRGDLERLLARLRTEARIDIQLVAAGAASDITIEAVSMRQIARIDPTAACFIAPGEKSWSGFRGRAEHARVRWGAQRELGPIAIFLPADSAPQEIRDCLQEEIAQALGPTNDLFHLPDTVFNDDNIHSTLTAFDMLILRILYSDGLRSGMSQSEVATRLPGILATINPKGQGIAGHAQAGASAEWDAAIITALTRANACGTRLHAAHRAVGLAAAMRPADHRLAYALMVRGRLSTGTDPAGAAQDFLQAHERFRSELGVDNPRTAQAALHLAIMALRVGDFARSAALASAAQPAARAAENAVLLSGLLAVEAEALQAMGRQSEAEAARLDSQRWSRYAFGSHAKAGVAVLQDPCR